MTAQAPVILCIMDGWGNSTGQVFNAVAKASTPVFDRLTHAYPTCQLRASEQAVGLPEGQPGNSEVGHLTIGSGRLIQQDLPRITAACASGEMARLPALVQLAERLALTCATRGSFARATASIFSSSATFSAKGTRSSGHRSV